MEGGVSHAIFTAYTGGQNMMEGKQFVKIFKDNNLLDKVLTTTDLDITFAKYKAKTEKKMSEPEFINAMKECAAKKKLSLDELLGKISTSGPDFKGTKAEKVALHDDKSKYTGVYAQGGPTNVDKDKHDLSKITVRDKKADVRGVTHEMKH